jgi:exonuclease SbcC
MLAGTLPWENLPHENPLGFISELSAKAAKYDANAKNIEKTRLGINTAGTVLENVDKIRKQIMDLMPGWNDGEIAPAEKSNMQELWIRLVGNVQSQLQDIEKCKKISEKYADEVEIFLGTHPQYSMERISALNRINLQVHNANAEFVNSRKTEVESCTAQYFSAQKDLATHLERKPETLAEEMSLETLNATKSGYDAQRDAHNIRKGVLEKEIKDDDLAIQQKGDTTQLDKLKEEYEKWRSFNKEFGDSEGKVLSRIAQSYVLGTLLNAANKYLKNMAPRYSLLVNPGTLNLKLEDKYNGFSTRSTNSISGGESFLVSLALALALADFGQHLGVSMLFIDEGFGTLSGEALQSALNTLKTLHTDVGRQVGIISHREEIRENIPVQIKVNLAPGTSTSTVEVLG